MYHIWTMEPETNILNLMKYAICFVQIEYRCMTIFAYCFYKQVVSSISISPENLY